MKNRIPTALTIAAATLSLFQGHAIAWPDCFTRGPVGASTTCNMDLAFKHTRPQISCAFICGPANSVADSTECVGDWDGNGCVVPADIAAFITCWFCSVANGTLDADIDCNSAVSPADVAAFVTYWINGVNFPVTWGC